MEINVTQQMTQQFHGKFMIENVQNKVRNKLSSIQTLYDICRIMTGEDADSKKSIETYEYLIKSNLLNTVKESIQDLIDIAAECDKKINDNTFDVWENVISNRN